MLSYGKPFLEWLHLHPDWGVIVAFLLSFFECLALVGLALPGVIFMTALGAFIGAGILPFTSIMWSCVLGAILGDAVSFWLGYHYHGHIRDLWPFRKYPSLFQKGEKFFFDHGGKGIFFGRFLGPIRPLLPLVAGMMSMRPWRFFLADIPSAILWAPVNLLPGVLVGYASQELAPGIETKLFLLALCVLLGLWCVWWLLKQIFWMVIKNVDRFFAWSWRKLQVHSFLRDILTDPLRPQSHGQLVLAVTGLLALIGFFVLLCSVHQHGVLIAWNEPVYYFMRSLRTTLVDPWMVAATTISPQALSIMWGAVLIWLVIRRYHWATLHWFVIGMLSFASRFIIKYLVQFPRPSGLLQTPAGWSFPSGHTLFSLVFLGFLMVMLARYWRRDSRWFAYGCISLLIGTVLFSRLYLGAHWLTDVTGSTLLGFALIALTTVSYCRRQSPVVKPVGTLLVAFVALAASWGWHIAYHFQQDLRAYTPVWTIQVLNGEEWWGQKDIPVPFYRLNRFGQPVELLNIQWAGSLSRIEQTLVQQHWNLLPKSSLLLLLDEISKKSPNQQLPVLSQFYENRKPVLILFKFVPSIEEVMVLRLWDVHLRLSNGVPLWAGTVSYHKPWRAHWFRHLKKTNVVNVPQPPLDLFSKDLVGWTWKTQGYPNKSDRVLLIR